MSKKPKGRIYLFEDLPFRVIIDHVLNFVQKTVTEDPVQEYYGYFTKDPRRSIFLLYKTLFLKGKMFEEIIVHKELFERSRNLEFGYWYSVSDITGLTFKQLTSLDIFNVDIQDIVTKNTIVIDELKKLKITFRSNLNVITSKLDIYKENQNIIKLFSNITELKIYNVGMLNLMSIFRIILLFPKLERLDIKFYNFDFDLDILNTHDDFITNDLKVENIFLKENFDKLYYEYSKKKKELDEILKYGVNMDTLKKKILELTKKKVKLKDEKEIDEEEIENLSIQINKLAHQLLTRRSNEEKLNKFLQFWDDYKETEKTNRDNFIIIEKAIKHMKNIKRIIVILNRFYNTLEESIWNYIKTKYGNVTEHFLQAEVFRFVEEEEEGEMEIEKKYF
jgi:hypothetical protein